MIKKQLYIATISTIILNIGFSMYFLAKFLTSNLLIWVFLCIFQIILVGLISYYTLKNILQHQEFHQIFIPIKHDLLIKILLILSIISNLGLVIIYYIAVYILMIKNKTKTTSSVPSNVTKTSATQSNVTDTTPSNVTNVINLQSTVPGVTQTSTDPLNVSRKASTVVSLADMSNISSLDKSKQNKQSNITHNIPYSSPSYSDEEINKNSIEQLYSSELNNFTIAIKDTIILDITSKPTSTDKKIRKMEKQNPIKKELTLQNIAQDFLQNYKQSDKKNLKNFKPHENKQTFWDFIKLQYNDYHCRWRIPKSYYIIVLLCCYFLLPPIAKNIDQFLKDIAVMYLLNIKNDNIFFPDFTVPDATSIDGSLQLENKSKVLLLAWSEQEITSDIDELLSLKTFQEKFQAYKVRVIKYLRLYNDLVLRVFLFEANAELPEKNELQNFPTKTYVGQQQILMQMEQLYITDMLQKRFNGSQPSTITEDEIKKIFEGNDNLPTLPSSYKKLMDEQGNTYEKIFNKLDSEIQKTDEEKQQEEEEEEEDENVKQENANFVTFHHLLTLYAVDQGNKGGSYNIENDID